ncbi:non-ribosomal peptide synthase [Photorhabdus khanii NC19]|uniref:Non-ribosomal peptide synthase n=1 Tax=Photorhabdus khanii NC19 TaxID=1004151 RepID=W3V2J7_9GAMM|nr:condensation domain-containing protein [Photorhabdus khanii]ETS29289.1 non-ribosomal peptide synthase [Photorhabdus khanii NC19]
MTLLSAWAVVLSRLSGQDDVVIGTPSAGRSRQEVESLIGFFVNTLALRVDLSGELTVTELLARVRQTALAAQEHQDLPFEQVVEIVQPPRRLAHTPLFQVMFAWQNNENTAWQLPGLAVSPVDQVSDIDIVKFDLELNLSEEKGRIVGALSYATALFDHSTIERQVGSTPRGATRDGRSCSTADRGNGYPGSGGAQVVIGNLERDRNSLP